MSNIDDFLNYREDARALFPVLTRRELCVVTRNGGPSWDHYNGNIAQYNIPEGYNIPANQAEHLVAYHEPGHEYKEWLDLKYPNKQHEVKFLAFIGVNISWAAQLALANQQTTVMGQKALDPNEWFAQQFANGVAGRKVVDLDHAKDPIATRNFFLSLMVEVTVLPYQDLTVANNNFYKSRDGWDIDTIVIHSMAGSWQSANTRFNNPTQQVSAHRAMCYDGIIRRWVEDKYTAYHCGVWQTNLRSLSIECEDMADSWGVRPDIIYSQCSAQVAEWVTVYPRIKLDRYHIVPGIVNHRDVKATACPAGLDTDRIVWLAKRIIEGVLPVAAFDPRNIQADKDWLDQRIRDVVMGEGIAGYAVQRIIRQGLNMPNAPQPPAALLAGERVHEAGAHADLEPEHHQRGDPPEGHPARTQQAGIHKAGKEDLE